MARQITIPTILSVILLTLTACDKADTPAEPPMRSVRYIEVQEGSAEKTRSFSGVSKSEQEADLSFKVSGTVMELNVAVGDLLEPGQLIARVDPSTFQLQTQQAQADLTRALAEQRNASSAYQRTRDLYENQNASKTDLDTARAAFESAEALVAVSQRALEIAQLNESYTRLVAADSCSVASTSVEVGENVSIGQEIISANCGDELKVDVSVPENLISLFGTGLDATVEFDSVPDTPYPGKVTEVGVAATGTTFPVSVRLANPEGLRAGLAAQVIFQFAGEGVAILVPVSAVAEDQAGRFVYLVLPGEADGTGIVRRQPVEVGDIVSEGMEITAGLSAGDKVVTAGVSVIREGLKVLLF